MKKNNTIKKASKKFTKRITKWEKKHPVATTTIIIADGAATIGGLVMGGVNIWKSRSVLKNIRNNQQTPPPQPQPQPQVPPTEDPNAATATSEA